MIRLLATSAVHTPEEGDGRHLCTVIYRERLIDVYRVETPTPGILTRYSSREGDYSFIDDPLLKGLGQAAPKIACLGFDLAKYL